MSCTYLAISQRVECLEVQWDGEIHRQQSAEEGAGQRMDLVNEWTYLFYRKAMDICKEFLWPVVYFHFVDL